MALAPHEEIRASVQEVVRVALVVYPGVLASAVVGLYDFFSKANAMSGAFDRNCPVFEVEQWGTQASPITALDESRSFSQLTKRDIVVVPPGSGEPSSSICSPEMQHWLQFQQQGGSMMTSACAGAFILAYAGVLNGRRATTHPMLRATLAERFPLVEVIDGESVVDAGDVITTDGVTTWMDLALRIAYRFGTARLAMCLAEFFLSDQDGAERRFAQAFSAPQGHRDAAIAEVQRWLRAHHTRQFKLSELAGVAKMSARTLQRRFAAATGLSLTAYFQRLRIQTACEHLLKSASSLDEVVSQVGYEDVPTFRKLFKRHMGVSPSEFRKRFGLKYTGQQWQEG